MDLVPPEILMQIWEYLDTPAPSVTYLHDQPALDLFTTKPGYANAPLKAASCVSRSWRTLVLPNLFRHVLWKPKVHSLSAFTLNPIPLRHFLDKNDLARGVVTFTLIVDYHEPGGSDYRFAPQIRTADLEWLWDQLFSAVDPLRFTLVARPITLAALLSCMLYLDDAWSFDMPYHILSLSRTTRRAAFKENADGTWRLEATQATELAAPSTSPASRRLATSSSYRPRKAPPCPLFTARPWTSLLLNEGSSTKVYRAYEFFLRRPPSVLGALLGCEEHPNDAPLIPSTLVDFNYIAIFPLSSHFEILLHHMPRIDRLFVQLTPRPGNGILENTEEMKYIDPADLWMERNTSYSYLMRELTSTNPRANWGLLRVFESGDAADREAWDNAVRYLNSSGIPGWKVEREGVFVKHTDTNQSAIQSDEANGTLDDFAEMANSNLLLV